MSSEFFDQAATSVAQRAILLLNHVLCAEPQATQRLSAHTGRTVAIQLHSSMPLISELSPLVMRITPAGLFELADPKLPYAPDLQLKIQGSDLKAVLLQALAGSRPRIDISGDAALAADMNWLFDNLRWEPFDDLARWWGDATASELARTANAASDGVRRVGAWVSTVLTRFLSEGSGGRKEF